MFGMTMVMDTNKAVSLLIESRRILVLGSSGSGKSRFSTRLGRVLGIRPVHLDAYFWRPDWVATPADEWNDIVTELIAEDSWIMDGTYERTLPLRIPAAEILIVIDSCRLACLGRILWRKMTDDGPARADAPPGQPIDWGYIGYIWQYPSQTRLVVQECIQECGREDKVVRLKGPRGANLLLERLKAHLDL